MLIFSYKYIEGNFHATIRQLYCRPHHYAGTGGSSYSGITKTAMLVNCGELSAPACQCPMPAMTANAAARPRRASRVSHDQPGVEVRRVLALIVVSASGNPAELLSSNSGLLSCNLCSEGGAFA